ncbi:hypothetical protein ACTPD5_21380, partial [Clostridioides difficile]
LDSIYVPEDTLLVKTLRKVYEEETGLDGTPLSSGGATYARALPFLIGIQAMSISLSDVCLSVP